MDIEILYAVPDLITVVEPPLTFEGMTVKPYGSMHVLDLGQVDLYDGNQLPPNYRKGVEARFFDIGGHPHQDDEFGLKLFPCFSEDDSFLAAKSAMEKQRLAHRAGCAPPVHRMVRVVNQLPVNSKYHIMWGYLTSIAKSASIEDPMDQEDFDELKAKLVALEVTETQDPEGELDEMHTDTLFLGNDITRMHNVGWYKDQAITFDFGTDAYRYAGSEDDTPEESYEPTPDTEITTHESTTHGSVECESAAAEQAG